MITSSQRRQARQPWAQQAIRLFAGQGLPERNWTARGGNVSLLRSVLGSAESAGQRSTDADQGLLGFLDRPIGGRHPYLLLETMVVPVRGNGRVQPTTIVMAIGVRASGHREVLGADVTEDLGVTFWLDFLRGLCRRGLDGVRLVTADDHDGLQLALRAVLPAAAWQRCLTHFVRAAVETVSPSARPRAAAMLRNVFAQRHREAARRAIDRITSRIAGRNPGLAELLRQADPASLTYYSFPPEHRRQIWSTNAERLLNELSQRCELVGTFPGRRTLVRLVAGVLEQQDARWQAAGRYCKPAAESAAGPADPIRQISLNSAGRVLLGAAS